MEEKLDLKLKECLDDYKLLDKYLREKGRRHNYYRNYSRFPRLSNNLYKDKVIYLSDGTGWNDKYDVEQFRNNKSKKKLFGLCFSYSIYESVAMWMLYGGLKDQGAMFYFTKGQMLKVIDAHPVITLGYFEKDTNRFIDVMTLMGDQYNMYIKDVLYTGKINNAEYRVYRDNVSGKTVKDVLKGARYVEKNAAWSYEKETRLIIEAPLKYDKAIIQCTHARISLTDVFDKEFFDKLNKQVFYSPKCEPSGKEVISYNDKKIVFTDSKLKGMIDWELK